MGFRIIPRRKRLENKLRNDSLTKNANIDNILKYVDEYEKDNLATIDKLKKDKLITSKKISGALKQTINAHGVITKILIGSATKRIMGSLIQTTSEPERPKQLGFILMGILTIVLMIIEAIYLKR